MLFRERRTDRLDPRRFRDDRVPYVTSLVDGRWETRLAPSAELAAELLVELVRHMGTHVSVMVDDHRANVRWQRRDVPVADIRDALVRLRPTLARFGGVGFLLEGDGDRLALTPLLELEISARTDRWRFLLDGEGLVAREIVPAKAWRKPGRAWDPVPELSVAVAEVVTRLGLGPPG